ncbi:MAG: hypothetical protein AAGG38_02140 [Planctomycetota bacterium]
MANSFVDKPNLTEPFPDTPPIWICPVTGWKVPKAPAKNLQWRAALLAQADADPGLQHALYQASSESLLFWLNAFGFTFRVQETDEAGKARPARHKYIPWVTWAIQDEHLLALEDAMETGYHLLTDKSRDMGSSWNHIGAIHHQFLFQDDSLFLELSRVESDVDQPGNQRSLMAKHDIIHKMLPEWMQPKIKRTRLHIVNESNGSRIDGESSNKAAGSGDRRKAALLDEMAKMEHGDRIKAAMQDVTPCILSNSTPWGPGTAYSKWRASGQVKVFVLPWWEHPEKGRGRYTQQVKKTKKWKIRSPWYDNEAKKRSPQEMAQEIDLDHIGSGDVFFEPTVIEEHKQQFARKPRNTFSIDFDRTVQSKDIPKILQRAQAEKVRARAGNELKVWGRLIGSRLDQTLNYVVACDISKGTGASNSVASVVCVETREKVAEWSDANTPPYEFGRTVCALCLWVGGARRNGRPLLIWEANGAPGWDFGRQVVKVHQYPFYWRDQIVGQTDEKENKRYGWHSSNQKKAEVLGIYRRALAHGGIINHSTEALNEALTYVHFTGGNIGPSALVAESESARATHGDRVIADMLAVLALGKAAGGRAAVGNPPKRLAPANSIGARMRARLRQRQRQAGRTFDFTTDTHDA